VGLQILGGLVAGWINSMGGKWGSLIFEGLGTLAVQGVNCVPLPWAAIRHDKTHDLAIQDRGNYFEDFVEKVPLFVCLKY